MRKINEISHTLIQPLKQHPWLWNVHTSTHTVLQENTAAFQENWSGDT